MIHPAVAVFEHNLISYRRVWRGSVLSSFVLPVLFLIGMGLSVGGYVNARGALGFDYVDYIAPGLLASTALQVAANESTWPVFSAFTWSRTYHSMRAAPLRVGDIVAGHLAYVLLRVLLAVLAFLIVMVLFGAVESPAVVAVLPVCLLLGLAVAAPVFAYAALINNDGMFAVLLRFGIIPMTLFAGVFFPVETLPLLARLLAYASPLWHGVELCRAASIGTQPAWGIGGHVAYLLLWCTVGLWAARYRFTKRLGD
jgi:lipooligosaccharide transport system permease protein